MPRPEFTASRNLARRRTDSPHPQEPDKIVAIGLTSAFLLMLIAIVLVTSFSLHRSAVLLSVGLAVPAPMIGIGLWVDVSLRRALRESWILPSQEGAWTRFRRFLWFMAIGMTLVVALQSVFGRFSALTGLVIAAVWWGIFSVMYLFLRKTYRQPRAGSPWWLRHFATAWADFRPRFEFLASARGFRVESHTMGEGGGMDSLAVLSEEGEIAITWRRRKGAVGARVKPGITAAGLKEVIEEAASG